MDLLDQEDRTLAESLAEMIILAQMDEMVGMCLDAKEVLKKFVL
jgi:hypothetical protein